VELLEALILGLLQGVLEWLPVSSEGNLVVLAVTLLGLEAGDALSLSVYLHLGTGLAALVYFREEVVRILRRGSERDRRLFRFLLVSTVVTGVVGLPLYTFIRLAAFYGEAFLALTGLALIVTGLIQRARPSEPGRGESPLGLVEGALLGAVQGFAILPGLSRSGLTTSALLFKGRPGEEAFRVSFLMSIPAIFSAVSGLALIEGVPSLDLGFAVALLSSFLAALLSIDALLKMARRLDFWGLCVLLGLLALSPFVFLLF
jgi:undecaprenyl-diphosphatase